MLTKALIVGLGGFLGAIARFGISNLSKDWLKDWPLGTLLVNLVGSFLLGMLVFGTFQNKAWPEAYRLLLAVGFCGSLTTMSTFAMDVINLSIQKELLSALSYFLLNIIGCLLMIVLARQVFG